MTNYTKWMLGLVVLMLCVSIIVIWNIQDLFSKTKELTIQDAAHRIELLYSGKVESFEQKENVYYLALDRNENTYDIQVDSKTGNIIKFSKVNNENNKPDSNNIKSKEEIQTLLQGKGTIHTITLHPNGSIPQYIVEITDNEVLKTLVVNAETGEIISEKVKEQTPTQPTVTAISSEKAKQIALSQLNGSVQYVVFEESSDGGYYLVEISNTKQNAVFEIHAISGKVQSVTRTQIPSTNSNKPIINDVDEDDDDDDRDDLSGDTDDDDNDDRNEVNEDDD